MQLRKICNLTSKLNKIQNCHEDIYYNTNNVEKIPPIIPPNIWWQWRNELMMIGADGADVVFDVRYDGSQLMVT